ncbi:hypothetical protein D9611_009992 [Ephemerocybe angulata]|uniref:Uncharacterized protein n=1 Tax=Ephemerocybe angulata TaxID=980116 RepID=A0A8H5FFI5_9AGAR|nr:hypothetical protein D9611_009992 [Tulosesus angulatus]
MRFTIISSITLLAATLTSGLVIPVDSTSGEIIARSELADDAYDAMIYRRRTSKTKKAAIAAARPAKQAAKAQKKASFAGAAKAHKATTNMPARNSKFKVPAGGGKPAHTYSGKEVRKEVFKGHMEAQRLKGLSKTQQKKSPIKPFGNRPHEVPKPGNLKPLKGMTPVVKGGKQHQQPGREWPMPNKAVPGTTSPVRVITQKGKKGNHVFRGVVAHDQSRTPGKGYNDHFQVKEQKQKTKRV